MDTLNAAVCPPRDQWHATWNGRGAVFIVGDVHGCADELEELLALNTDGELIHAACKSACVTVRTCGCLPRFITRHGGGFADWQSDSVHPILCTAAS